MQKSGFFMEIIFCRIPFKVSAWLSNHAVCKIGLKPSIVLIDQITIKTSKPKCHLNLCLIEFIDWRCSKSLFSTSCKLTPLYLLSSSPPPPLHVWIGTGLHIHSIQCVTGGGRDGVMWRAYTGVIHCVFDQIPNQQNYFLIRLFRFSTF